MGRDSTIVAIGASWSVVAGSLSISGGSLPAVGVSCSCSVTTSSVVYLSIQEISR